MLLDNCTILITGGLGQVGIAIIRHLRSKHSSATIHVLDLHLPLPESSQVIPNVSYHAGNVTDSAAMCSVFEDVKPDVIFHTAGLIPQIAVRLGLNNEKSFMEVNVEGTRTILRESERVGSVKAFVYTSSADVVKGRSWQNISGVGEDIEIPKHFDGPYAKSKALADELVLSSSKPTFPTTALRAHAVFSADDRNIIPLLIAAPRNIRLGPGTNLYDFTYAPNLALAHCLAASNLLNNPDLNLNPDTKSTSPARETKVRKSAAGKPFFITNAEPIPFRDFLSWIYAAYDGEDTNSSTAVKPSSKVTEIPIGVAKVMVWISEAVARATGKKLLPITMQELEDSVSERWFDNGAAMEVLGYVPEVKLRDGVRIAVQGFKTNGRKGEVSGAALAA